MRLLQFNTIKASNIRNTTARYLLAQSKQYFSKPKKIIWLGNTPEHDKQSILKLYPEADVLSFQWGASMLADDRQTFELVDTQNPEIESLDADIIFCHFPTLTSSELPALLLTIQHHLSDTGAFFLVAPDAQASYELEQNPSNPPNSLSLYSAIRQLIEKIDFAFYRFELISIHAGLELNAEGKLGFFSGSHCSALLNRDFALERLYKPDSGAANHPMEANSNEISETEELEAPENELEEEIETEDNEAVETPEYESDEEYEAPETESDENEQDEEREAPENESEESEIENDEEHETPEYESDEEEEELEEEESDEESEMPESESNEGSEDDNNDEERETPENESSKENDENDDGLEIAEAPEHEPEEQLETEPHETPESDESEIEHNEATESPEPEKENKSSNTASIFSQLNKSLNEHANTHCAMCSSLESRETQVNQLINNLKNTDSPHEAKTITQALRQHYEEGKTELSKLKVAKEANQKLIKTFTENLTTSMENIVDPQPQHQALLKTHEAQDKEKDALIQRYETLLGKVDENLDDLTPSE